MEKQETFSHWKQQSARKANVSKKGSMDEDFEETVRLINQQERYFTTSSCSGRALVSSIIQKQNCSWLVMDEFVPFRFAKKNATGDVVLKFEPFILHVQSRALEDAQILSSVNHRFANSDERIYSPGANSWRISATCRRLINLRNRSENSLASKTRRQLRFANFSRFANFTGNLQIFRRNCLNSPITICKLFFFQHNVAINAGFRNSGITVGKKGKIIMAVRRTMAWKSLSLKMASVWFHSCLHKALQKGVCVHDMLSKHQVGCLCVKGKEKTEVGNQTALPVKRKILIQSLN
ncbi:hypothetical protein XELAEV_18025080mg [Xenopus laevis]|uniref:tRNA wybutosine-synthesizing protein 3 homolog n=1 Tax=Xenopus laevis TaxID=8355 RepID=A0A974HM05_XENLA|nr:hypothetical protein XELAEV_18025080mg [Xenopus laevis]